MYTASEHTKTQLFTSLTVKLIIKADECSSQWSNSLEPTQSANTINLLKHNATRRSIPQQSIP